MIFSSENKTVQGCSAMYPPIYIGGCTLHHTHTRGANCTEIAPKLHHCTKGFKHLVNCLLSDKGLIAPKEQKESCRATKKNQVLNLVQLHQKKTATPLQIIEL